MSNTSSFPPAGKHAFTEPKTCTLPFFSIRTLAREHILLKDLGNGIAIYAHNEGTFATIGTRGLRSLDGAAGLIIHIKVHRAEHGAIEVYSGGLVQKTFYNLEHTTASGEELLQLLMKTLEETGVVLQR